MAYPLRSDQTEESHFYQVRWRRYVVKLLAIHQTNKTIYHPQTDGLVKQFNFMLTTMLAKTAKKGGCNWDKYLPYVLFAYHASEQQSTRESLFFLLHGWDRKLPSELALSPSKTRQQVDLHVLSMEFMLLIHKLSEACNFAKRNIKNVQKQQKTYNQHARPPNLQLERAFSYLNYVSELGKNVS